MLPNIEEHAGSHAAKAVSITTSQLLVTASLGCFGEKHAGVNEGLHILPQLVF